MRQFNIYKKEFASVYDKLMNKAKYNRWKKLIKRTLKKYSVQRGCALDVACGTGKISKILLDLGFKKVYGLDASRDMLDIAKRNLAKYGKRFETIEKDMVLIDQQEQFDFIVSFYDSINYLLDPSQVDKLLGRFEKALKPGGIVLFDVNTKEHCLISKTAPKKIFKIDGSTITFTYGSKGEFWKIDILLNKNGKIFKETHLERGYSSDEIKTLLKNKNFTLLELLSETKIYWDNKKHLGKQYYILRKICKS